MWKAARIGRTQGQRDRWVGVRTFEGGIGRRWWLEIEVVGLMVWVDLEVACRGVVGDRPMLDGGMLGRDF